VNNSGGINQAAYLAALRKACPGIAGEITAAIASGGGACDVNGVR